MDKTELMQRMEAGEFRANNGRVLRTINILKEKYVHLATLRYALPELAEGDIIKSVNFLELERYIQLRNIETHEDASLADSTLDAVEARLSGKGVRFLAGSVRDDCIEL